MVLRLSPFWWHWKINVICSLYGMMREYNVLHFQVLHLSFWKFALHFPVSFIYLHNFHKVIESISL